MVDCDHFYIQEAAKHFGNLKPPIAHWAEVKRSSLERGSPGVLTTCIAFTIGKGNPRWKTSITFFKKE